MDKITPDTTIRDLVGHGHEGPVDRPNPTTHTVVRPAWEGIHYAIRASCNQHVGRHGIPLEQKVDG